MKITVEDEYSGRVLSINGECSTFEDVICISKTMMEFLTFNAKAVCERIAEDVKEI